MSAGNTGREVYAGPGRGAAGDRKHHVAALDEDAALVDVGRYNGCMPSVAGVVVDGRVKLEKKLPDGTRVRVWPDDEGPMTLGPKAVRALAQAGRSLDRGEGIPAEKVLKRLARRRPA